MSNEIDILMDLDPLELSERNKEDIIAYFRKQRGNFESGVKSKKDSTPINLVELGLKKAAPPIRRI